MATEASNKIKYLMATKVIDFDNDSFKIILMTDSFIFNKDTHHAYADVSASELGTGNGYTAGGATLSGVTVTEDDTNDYTSIVANNATWTASGGAIGPTIGAIIYDDTVAAPTAKPIVGFIDFATAQTQADGGVATISSIEVRIS